MYIICIHYTLQVRVCMYVYSTYDIPHMDVSTCSQCTYVCMVRVSGSRCPEQWSKTGYRSTTEYMHNDTGYHNTTGLVGKVYRTNLKACTRPKVGKFYHWIYSEPAENRLKSLSAGGPKSDFVGNQWLPPSHPNHRKGTTDICLWSIFGWFGVNPVIEFANHRVSVI